MKQRFLISVLIPLIGYKNVSKTIESVVNQGYEDCEILILRNGLNESHCSTEIWEKRSFCPNSSVPMREIFIPEKGKGNALNEGVKLVHGDIVAVVDADCVLCDEALKTAVKHFENENVAAVGGRLLVMEEDRSLLEKLQSFEYMKSFQFSRRMFAQMNAQCLISGAFGLFRKSDLLEIGGFDDYTVGEDMEVVLHLQNTGFRKSKRRVIYEPNAVCETKVPHDFGKLLHQRDRWQRGLTDCVIKHRNMVLNPHYGFLRLFAMSYQTVFELLKPFITFIGYILAAGMLLKCFMPGLCYWIAVNAFLEFGIALIAEYIELWKDIRKVLRRVPYIVTMTMAMMAYQVPITISRLYGVLSFRWRKMVW